MSRIAFLFRQLLGGPTSVIFAPFRSIVEVYQQSGRGRSFVLSLPALFVIVFGIVLLVASQVGREQRLTRKYDELAHSANNSSSLLREDFDRAWSLYQLGKMKRNEEATLLDQPDDPTKSGSESEGGASDVPGVAAVAGKESEPSSSFFELRDRYLALKNEEKLYLLKLIELNPNEYEYRYRYALAHQPFFPDVQLQLVSALAPLENSSGVVSGGKLGYPDAHLWLAQYFLNRQPKDEQEAKLRLLMIEKHAKSCLDIDSGNDNARRLLAEVLVARSEMARAYDEFKVLFQTDPRIYAKLVQINSMLNRENLNVDILDDAARRLSQEITRTRTSDQEISSWESAWESYAGCMMQRKRFAQLKSELQTERQLFDDELKRSFLDEILIRAFSQRTSELQSRFETDRAAAEEAVMILEMASESGELNDLLKYSCTMINRKVPEFSDRAKKIYDYSTDADPSALVLAEIAIEALGKKDYQSAIDYLERARAKLPQNPVILNNLAYAYLSAENASPDLSLKLVDQAIVFARQGQVAPEEFSRFLHTRGTALLQLNRVDEARVAFTDALLGRPDNESILESLIRCCEGRDESQKAVFQKKLDEIRSAKAAAPAGTSSNN